MVIKWDEGEFLYNDIKKKKILLIEGDNKIPINDFRDKIDDITDSYQNEKFKEMERTVIPLGKSIVGSFEELKGFIAGFFTGVECESRNLKIKVEDVPMSNDEKKHIDKIKFLGNYLSQHDE